MFSEMPLFLFTLLGGLAAGIYVMAACFPKAFEGKKPFIVPAVVLVLLAVGGVALLFHLGRPERMILAFRNISAGITQEAYATIAFGVVVVIDLVMALTKKPVPQALRVVGAVLGVVLVVVMANAYFGIATNAAMNSVATFALFILCAAAMGSTFAGALCVDETATKTVAKISTGTAALAAVSMLIEGAVFVAAGLDIAPFAVAAVVAAAGAACAWLAPKKGTTLAYAACALVVVASAISRYAFYLAI
ncbi:MAG: dimethyl sulfoxide reductase anchor subunit [Eggerthellaceae bacterium]|nr:dimethyl sulfoxide reductase anchor subunit [Eggerthellaceae bacterium]